MSKAQCILLTDDYLPHIGGSRVYYHKVAGLLGGLMGVVTRKHAGAGEFDSAAGYPIRRVLLRGSRLDGLAGIGESLDAASLAAAAREFFDPPECFLAGEVMPSAFAARLAAFRARVRYGVFVHDEPLMGAGRFEKVLRKRALSGAGVIIASSTFAASRAAEVAGKAVPIISAPPGVDTETFCPGEPDPGVLARFGVAPRRYLLSVGRLVGYKNVETVIRALAGVKSRALALVVVGEGPERAALEDVAKGAGLNGRVVFAGSAPTEDLAALYRGALAYVFPSRQSGGLQHEGIGMAALEAAACGALVIASTETSAGDFVREGETGYLFDPSNPAALSAIVDRLAASPAERDAVARRACEAVLGRYTWQRAAEAVREAVERLSRVS